MDKVTEELQEKIIGVKRVCKTVKGGRIFSFTALSVVGDKKGKIGLGYGKAREVPLAIQKSITRAKRNMISIILKRPTIHHPIKIYYTGTCVYMLPAIEGTGLIASKSIRAILEAVGIKNILTKTYGSTNPLNVAKAVFIGLANMKTRNIIAKKRGKKFLISKGINY